MGGLGELAERRHGVALTAERERFAELIRRGVNNSEACRIVGISRKTGTRWRLGRTIRNTVGEAVHYPPVVNVKPPTSRSDRYLSMEERTRISDLQRAGAGVRSIAAELGRPPSTISRELRRNGDDLGRYLPQAAQRLADARRRRPRQRRVTTDPTLGAAVCSLLTKKWSPEQVAHELTLRFPDEPTRQLCPESIYQAIYDPNTALTRPAKHSLRSHRRRRRRRTHGLSRRGRIPDMTMIGQRPPEVADRVEAGHWEGDLIMGETNKSAIATLVERKTRYVLLAHLPAAHTAENVNAAITTAMADLPPWLRRTLTWDQGKELSSHRQLAQTTGLDIYFCDPHSPWQRGTNENMNGLLRQYFPKSTDLSVHTVDDLTLAADEINARPRKTLDWATPADLLRQLLCPA